MSELTKEYFDQVLKGLATKEDLKAELASAEKRIIKRIDEAQEELARIVNDTIAVPFTERFDRLEEQRDVAVQLKVFERKFQKLEEALHIKL